MYFKIALSNVKKSFKDYSIYFLTLMFAVCIFYSFNSIESQQVLLVMDDYQKSYLDILGQIMGIVSVFVSFILGGLILYGNNFLIKKRKKELGIYMTLGMAKNKIAGILLTETIVVGTVALGIGLILGVIGSQGLSILTARLFTVDMSGYTFILSGTAILKTIFYFGIIFVLVMLFNTIQLSKYELIELLHAAKKNEKLTIGSGKLASLLFCVSIVLLGMAYALISEVGLKPEERGFWMAAALGCIGTFLYFKSLMTFCLAVTKRYRNFYLRRLNSFIMRQMHSKVSTNVVSMTMICLMLFLTIGGLSTGLSFKHTLEKGLKETTPYDATIYMYHDEGEEHKDIEGIFESLDVTLQGSESYSIYHEYRLDQNISELLGHKPVEGVNAFEKISIYMIPLSEYNSLRALMDNPELELKTDEVMITSNQSSLIKVLEDFLEKEDKVTIEGQLYSVKDQMVKVESLASTGFNNNFITLVVPDELVQKYIPKSTVMNIQYGGEDREASESKFAELFAGYKEGIYKGVKLDYSDGFINGMTRMQIYAEHQGLTTMILFVGIYLGIIFLISSAAVLALQQLSEASDSRERYQVLKKIGTPTQMIGRSILIQTLIYFMLPLSLAFVHAVVGIAVVNEFLAMYGKPDIMGSSIITLLLLLLVYGGYFYITYIGYKNIAIEKEK